MSKPDHKILADLIERIEKLEKKVGSLGKDETKTKSKAKKETK